MQKVISLILIILTLCSCSTTTVEISSSSSNNKTETTASTETVSAYVVDESMVKVTEEKYAPEIWEENAKMQITTDNLPDTREELRSIEWYSDYPDRNQIYFLDDRTDNEEVEGYYDYCLPNINNNIDLKEVIYTCGVSEISVFSEIGEYDRNPYYQSGLGLLLDKNGENPLKYPINFLRRGEGNCYYTVRKVNSGGWLYIFFDNPMEFGEYIYTDETIIVCTGCMYVENIHNLSEFKNLSIGDSIDAVKAIDSATTVYEVAHLETMKYNYRDLPEAHYNFMTTRHLLEDGLLTISYEYTDNKFIVTDIDYSEEYIFHPTLLEKSFGDMPRIYKILPQDYPPAS